MFIEIIRKLKSNGTGSSPQETKWHSDSGSVEEETHSPAMQHKGSPIRSPHPLRSSPRGPESQLHIGLVAHEESQVKVRPPHPRPSFHSLLSLQGILKSSARDRSHSLPITDYLYGQHGKSHVDHSIIIRSSANDDNPSFRSMRCNNDECRLRSVSDTSSAVKHVTFSDHIFQKNYQPNKPVSSLAKWSPCQKIKLVNEHDQKISCSDSSRRKKASEIHADRPRIRLQSRASLPSQFDCD